jgi:hypothetical protein
VATDASLPPNIPEDLTRALAASGALCERCGGIHQVSVDQVVLALYTQNLTHPPRNQGEFVRATKATGVAVPWCTCGEECPTCGPFLAKVTPMIESLQRNRQGGQVR